MAMDKIEQLLRRDNSIEFNLKRKIPYRSPYESEYIDSSNRELFEKNFVYKDISSSKNRYS